jgi:hypothetical protein
MIKAPLMKNCLLLLLFLICSVDSIFSQSKLSLDNVVSVQLRNAGPIIANEEIKGYFLFYQSDKINKTTNEYTLQVMDENVNKVKDIKLTDSKNLFLIESSFNGNDIMFMFYNRDEKALQYRVYGIDGNEKVSYRRPIDAKNLYYFERSVAASSEENQNNNLFAIDGKGFISVMNIAEHDRVTFEINYYGGNQNNQWTYSPADARRLANAQYLGSSDSVAVFEVTRAKFNNIRDEEHWLLGLYLSNGSKAFEFETDKERYGFRPMNIQTGKNSRLFLLMGSYYDKGDWNNRDQSLGLAVWVMSNQGRVINQKYSSWESDISKYIKTDNKGKVANLGYVYFHKIIQTQDGKIFGIGEGYGKAVSGLTVSRNRIDDEGVRAKKMRITDMVLLQFDNTFTITDARIFEKNTNSIDLPIELAYFDAATIAQFIKGMDGFDYSFLQTDKQHSMFTVGYTDYVKSKDYKGLTFNTISYYNNNLTTDRIELKSSSSKMKILPARTGSVMIMEYFKKDKRLDMRLEKIN